MIIEIKVPSVGESVTEALLAQWFQNNGESITKDEPLFVIETDKVTLEVAAEADGVLSIQVEEGVLVEIGSVVGTIDTQATTGAEEARPAPGKEAVTAPELKAPTAETPQPDRAIADKPAPTPGAAQEDSETRKILAPSVRQLVAEKKVDVSLISGTGPGGRITKGDALLYLESASASSPAVPGPAVSGEKEISRELPVGEIPKTFPAGRKRSPENP